MILTKFSWHFLSALWAPSRSPTPVSWKRPHLCLTEFGGCYTPRPIGVCRGNLPSCVFIIGGWRLGVRRRPVSVAFVGERKGYWVKSFDGQKSRSKNVISRVSSFSDQNANGVKLSGLSDENAILSFNQHPEFYRLINWPSDVLAEPPIRSL